MYNFFQLAEGVVQLVFIVYKIPEQFGCWGDARFIHRHFTNMNN